MKAGRELDGLVAEHVMGLPRPDGPLPPYTGNEVVIEPFDYMGWVVQSSGYDAGDELEIVPHRYSTDIAAAWQVVEATDPACEWSVTKTAGDEYHCEIRGVLSGCTTHAEAYADTAPLSICLAALQALGVEVPA